MNYLGEYHPLSRNNPCDRRVDVGGNRCWSPFGKIVHQANAGKNLKA
jgi:hypothetical protein